MRGPRRIVEAAAKAAIRRDLHESGKRGTRRRPDPASSYEAYAEAGAIQKRAAAWSRVGDHYARAGDKEAAQAIREYVADRFDYHPDAAVPVPTPTALPTVEALERTTTSPERVQERSRDEGRER